MKTSKKLLLGLRTKHAKNLDRKRSARTSRKHTMTKFSSESEPVAAPFCLLPEHFFERVRAVGCNFNGVKLVVSRG